VAVVLTALFFAVPTAHAQVDQSPTADAPSLEAAAEAPAVPVKVIQATVTAYATGADNGVVGSMTASGSKTHWGTVAADWRLYPSGTRLQIEGFPNEIFTVEDTGGGVRGNIFDIWFPDLPTAVAFGTKTLRVTVLADK
jgi:3D (Asp-Asp-Asp) domain-containing protein